MRCDGPKIRSQIIKTLRFFVNALEEFSYRPDGAFYWHYIASITLGSSRNMYNYLFLESNKTNKRNLVFPNGTSSSITRDVIISTTTCRSVYLEGIGVYIHRLDTLHRKRERTANTTQHHHTILNYTHIGITLFQFSIKHQFSVSRIVSRGK